MQAAAGTTVFMSTHTLAIAEEIADRIGIMDHGRLHFLGTVGELQRELASHHDVARTALPRIDRTETDATERRRRKAEGECSGRRDD